MSKLSCCRFASFLYLELDGPNKAQSQSRQEMYHKRGILPLSIMDQMWKLGALAIKSTEPLHDAQLIRIIDSSR